MVFFLTGGPMLWVMSAISIFMAGAGGIALGTLDAELFPTEVRSHVERAARRHRRARLGVGLVVAGGLSDQLGGLGRSIALTGIGALARRDLRRAAAARVGRARRSTTSARPDAPTPDEYGPDP